MTISTTPSEKSYAGDGTSTAFTIPFVFDTAADLKVIHTDEDGNTISVTTGFTVTGGSGSTGTLTYDSAPADGITITILDNPELKQSLDYVSNDAFPADVHERGLDNIVRMIKRLHQRITRCARTDDGDPASGSSMLFPTVEARRGKFAMWADSTIAKLEPAVSLPVGTALSQSIIVALLYPQTTEESDAGVTPTNLAYPVLNVLRYGADPTGVADSTQAFKDAIAVADQYAADGVGGKSMVHAPTGSYLITGELTFPDNWVGLRGDGIQNTQLILSGDDFIGINVGSRATYEYFSVLGSDMDDGQTGIRVSGAQITLREIYVRDCNQGLRFVDAFIVNCDNVRTQFCENSTVFCINTAVTGFETATAPRSQNVNFKGGSLSSNTYAVRMLGARNVNFDGTDIEANQFAIAWTENEVSGCNWDKCWIENNFIALYIDKQSGGQSLNNNFSRCILHNCTSTDLIPTDFTDLDESRFLYTKTTTGGINDLTFEGCIFLKAGDATVGVELNAALNRTFFIRNFWTSSLTYEVNVSTNDPIGIDDGLFGNHTINTGLIATDGDTTPSARTAKLLRFDNANATTITDFDDEDTNQEIEVLFDGNTTISDNANISLAAGANYTPDDGHRMWFRNISGVWTEQGRTLKPAADVGAGATTDQIRTALRNAQLML